MGVAVPPATPVPHYKGSQGCCATDELGRKTQEAVAGVRVDGGGGVYGVERVGFSVLLFVGEDGGD